MSQRKEFSLTEPDGQLMPLAFRWFVVHGLIWFKPWYFDYDASPERNVRRAFRIETGGRDLVPFAFRQDNDDMAGFEVIDGRMTDRVIAFHPSWTEKLNLHIIDREFEDLWSFVRDMIISDMEDWANEDDAAAPDKTFGPFGLDAT
jgi:hypothetical protein